MNNITHLNDRITQLRNHRNKTDSARAAGSGKIPQSESSGSNRERRFATDFFMLIAYSLLGFALLSQFFLIAWLDIV